MLLQIVSVLLLMISTVFCTPAGDKQNNMQPVRKDKSMPDTRGTLDPIGGGNLLKLVNSYREEESSWMQTLLKIGLPFYWLGDKFFTDKDQQNSTKQQPVHKDKPETDTRGTLDPLGGGNFVRLVDNYREDEPSLIKKMAVTMYVLEKILFHKNSQPNITQPVHKEKPQPDTRGTLDPLGGDNFVRLDESYREEPSLIKKIAIAMSLYEWYFFHHYDQQNITEQPVRKEKPQPDRRGTLDSLGGGNFVRSEQAVGGGRQNMARLAREDKSQKTNPVLKLVDPYRNEQIYRSLDRAHFLESLDNFQGGEVLRILEAVTGGDLLSSLDPTEGMAVLTALRSTHTKHPKRMLDSVSGWSFGESKRNFDEIDNVGFNGFAKRSPYQHLAGGNSRNFLSSLAKKNFDEIDRAGFETYNKRDFDEIDRTGFENFQKRDRKE